MNNLLCSLCIEYFNQALRSPLGKALASYFSSIENPLPDEINIFIIKSKLDENKYKTPEEWLGELQHVVQRSILFFGADSEITLALLSIQRTINKSAKPLLKATIINKHSTEWHESILRFRDILSDYISNCPNDITSFNSFTASSLPPQVIPPRALSTPTKQSSNSIDIYELKDLIQRQISDKDLEHLGNIVSRYEPDFSKVKGLVDCDLKKLSTFTQNLLYEYASKHAAPKRVPSSLPPRIKSTPLPQSLVANYALQKSQNIGETSPFLAMGNETKPTEVDVKAESGKQNIKSPEKTLNKAENSETNKILENS